MHRLGRSSNRKLNTCHQDIQMIVREAIQLSVIDFGIAEGERSLEKQMIFFKAGKAQCRCQFDCSTLQYGRK